MKLVTFRRGSALLPGALISNAFGDSNGDHILDLNAAFSWHERDEKRDGSDAAIAHLYGGSILGLIERETTARPVAEALIQRAVSGELGKQSEQGKQGKLPSDLLVPLEGADLVSPIPRPPSMRDGYAFRQHVEAARRNRGVEMIAEFDSFPVFYFTNHHAVIGPGELAVRPMQRERLDYELEAAIVIGKPGRDIPAERADEHVFGYMIMNDWSARAVQMEEMKLSLGPAKGKDFATGLGPYLVTCDELAARRVGPAGGQPAREGAGSTGSTGSEASGARYDLGMRAWVNDVLLSQGNLKDMTWSFAQIIERVSYGVSVFPGEVIGSGTVGTGCLLELNGSKITQNQWLQPGDRVVLEIDQLGRLENTIVGLDP